MPHSVRNPTESATGVEDPQLSQFKSTLVEKGLLSKGKGERAFPEDDDTLWYVPGHWLVIRSWGD